MTPFGKPFIVSFSVKVLSDVVGTVVEKSRTTFEARVECLWTAKKGDSFVADDLIV